MLKAANVDLVLVTVPVFPEPKPAMVERFVALAWDSGATSVLVVTKTDLSTEAAAIVADLAEAVPGVEVLAVSATTGEGITELRAAVPAGRTACLIRRGEVDARQCARRCRRRRDRRHQA